MEPSQIAPLSAEMPTDEFKPASAEMVPANSVAQEGRFAVAPARLAAVVEACWARFA